VGADFDVNLRKLQLKVKDMVENATQNAGIAGSGEGVLEKFEKLQKDLEDVGEVVKNANIQLDIAKQEGDQAGENVARAESLMSRAKDTLHQAQSRLDQEGKEAYRRAEVIAERMGTGNALITEVAQKARKLAAEQSENASEVESIAKQAKEESQAAYDKALNAMNERIENQNEIEKLKYQLNVMGTELAEVQSYATSTLSAADASYKEALQNKLLALRLEVPEVVTNGQDSFVDMAEKVMVNATRIRDSADTLIRDNENVVREVMNKRADLGDLLMQSEAQQQQIDLKIAQMDEYRNEARKAVELGNNVLSQAKETLKVLEEFDSKVEQNRADFTAIMRTTEDIERTLTNSNTKTAQASDAIKKIDGDTYTAFDIANESKEKAEEASTEAKRIVEESHAAKSVASELKAAANDMANKLTTTTDLVNEKENIALIDATLATEALKEANKAQNSSGDASSKVVQAKLELDEITVLLENIDDPDPLVLDELSRRLDEAERKFEEADLEARLIKLEDMKQEQITRKTELRKEYESVKAEVEVIAGIIEKLPNSCPSIHGDHSSGMLEN